MKSRPLVLLALACIFTLAAPTHFVVQTVLADTLSAATMTAVLTLGAFILVTVVTGIPRMDEIRALGWSGVGGIALAGALGVFASQYLVLANRYSDAPPGSEVIFFTTAAWGVLAVIAAMWTRRKPSAAQLVASGIALMGAAGILANWERPSSFSPLVRYPQEHLAMIAAGVAWAMFSVLLATLGRRAKLRAVLVPATGAAALVAVAVALVSPGRLEVLSVQPETWTQLFVASCAFAAMLVSWSWLIGSEGVARPASLLFLPPVTLTVLGIFEARVGAGGPSPLLWHAVFWASAATLAGAVGVATLGARAPRRAEKSDAEPRVKPTGMGRWLVTASVAAAVAACATGAAALVMPALSASVQGTRAGGGTYQAAWMLPGAETPAGWLAFLAAVLALAAGIALLRNRGRHAWALTASLCAGVAVAAVPALLSTPLRTWTRWIPTDVQQDYGTEYARLTFERVQGPTAKATLVLVGASVVLLVAAVLASRIGRFARGGRRFQEAVTRTEGAE